MTGQPPPQPPRQPPAGHPPAGSAGPPHNYLPGWAPGPPGAPGYPYPPPPPSHRPRAAAAIWLLAAAGVLGLVLGLSLIEDHQMAWHSVHAWGAVAIVAAALTAAPAAGPALGRAAPSAVRVSLGAAGALVLYWVLFVLPEVGSNTSLLTTIGVAAGAAAARIATQSLHPAERRRW